MSDRASQVLAQGVPPGVPKSYRALADHGGVPHSTLHHRARGRRSIEQKAESQRYLTPLEENAVVKFLLQMSDLGQPVRQSYCAGPFPRPPHDPVASGVVSLQPSEPLILLLDESLCQKRHIRFIEVHDLTASKNC